MEYFYCTVQGVKWFNQCRGVYHTVVIIKLLFLVENGYTLLLQTHAATEVCEQRGSKLQKLKKHQYIFVAGPMSVKWQVRWLNLFHHYNKFTQLHITTVEQSIIKVLYMTALTFRLCLWVTHISTTTARLCESLSKVHVTKTKPALSFFPFLFECQLFCSVL